MGKNIIDMFRIFYRIFSLFCCDLPHWSLGDPDGILKMHYYVHYEMMYSPKQNTVCLDLIFHFQSRFIDWYLQISL